MERDVAIDILKGIGILFVLVAHSVGGYIHTLAYSFHIPLFFIVTGYFFKPKPILDAMKNDFIRLFLPFYFTALVMFFASLILFPLGMEEIKTPSYTFQALIYGNASSSNYNKIWGNLAVVGSVWFLPALFWAKTAFNIILQKVSKYVTVLILVCGGIAALVGQFLILPYSLLQGISALPFLLIGFYAKEYGGFGKIVKDISSSIVLQILVLVLFVAWFLTTFSHSLSIASFKWKLFYYPNILFASAGTFFFYLISTLIARKIEYLSKLLAFFGKYSIILICFPVIESYIIPLNTLIPAIPFKNIAILGCKVLWCVLAIVVSFEIPFLRKIFSIKDRNLIKEIVE